VNDTTRRYRLETIAACPVCGSADITDWVRGRDQLLGHGADEFLYAHCNNCGVYFQKTRPTEDTVSYFYEGNYGPYGQKARPRPPLWPLQKLMMSAATRIAGEHAAKRRIQDIYAGLDANSVLLDFGCGSGKALDTRRARTGCRTIGIDFNNELLDKVRARGHEAYFANAEGWSHIPDASVDVITMNHVIEHLYHPLDDFKQMRRVLKPGGKLDIATPNPNGYSAQTFGTDWFGLDCPRHIVIYGPEAAAKVLRQAGFSSVETIPNPVIKDVVRSKARHAKEQPKWAIEADGWRALKAASLVKREAARGRYDQYHLVASP
jgi:ubiquinone/menaquinone biosynthesis C-methylase UbiE